MPRNSNARVEASVGALTLSEISWINTLDVGDAVVVTAVAMAADASSSPKWATAPSSPTWTTAPSSPDWPSSKVMSKMEKRDWKRARNRVFAKIARERKEVYAKEVEAKVVEIEQVNKALRAQVELELEKNAALRESLGLGGELCVE